VRAHVMIGLVVIVLMAGAAAGLLAQDSGAAPSKVGVVQFYAIESEAPQFAEARAAISALEERASALSSAARSYTMLEPEEFDRALEIEQVADNARTADQIRELRALKDQNQRLNSEMGEILQLRPDKRTPQTDARADELNALYSRCRAHWMAKGAALDEELDGANRELQERVTARFEEAVATVAAARGLELVVQHSIRTTGVQVDTGLPIVEYHRVVHYNTGPDITDEVLAELKRQNAEELGLPAVQ
jgi:Skp family chaperone for outer membrane proteins